MSRAPRQEPFNADTITRTAPQQARVATPRPPIPNAAPKGRPGRPSAADKARRELQALQEREAALAAKEAELNERERALGGAEGEVYIEERIVPGGERGETYETVEVESAAPLARRAPRPPREAPRSPAREPSRPGAIMVTGRDGEQLTRRRAVVGDVYHVEPHEIPKGWTYQWNQYEVTGQQMVESQLQMHANGWRPVPASRHPGRWMQHGYEGQIIVKGLRLEERPVELTREAQAEDIAHARAQVRDQTDALKLSKRNLPDGMAVGKGYRHTGAEVRMSIDPGLDIPHPEHQVEE